ncbi:MAG: methylenetetrahydrofolate reductase C-terminal domain-containing protein [Planctomycetota bacterium]|nr:methylenetetrahydrofolate reductase C-terminal domain-containing protein [Planctomycetota bacterium]
MIVTQEKPIDEILGFIEPFKRVLVLGCDGCTQPPRGLKEAEVCAELIRLAGTLKSKGIECRTFTVSRQCDNNILKKNLAPQMEGIDAVLSMACGIGPQTIVEVFPTAHVFPAQNTLCMGSENMEQATFAARCQGCGNCILDRTGGICPITQCAKSLQNGPCGGTREGKCETSKEIACGWQLIFDRMKALGRLQELVKFMPPKDWSTSIHGGLKRHVRKDLVAAKVGEQSKGSM